MPDMTDDKPFSYAARLNSFKIGAGQDGAKRPAVFNLLSRAAKVPGLNAVDLNFPDHLDAADRREMKEHLAGLGLAVNGFAMRFYGDPGFKLGAFTNPEARLRRLAIDQTKRGIDQMLELGGSLMTLWMGQDGFDYSFQADYARLWDQTLDAVAEVAGDVGTGPVLIRYEYRVPEGRRQEFRTAIRRLRSSRLRLGGRDWRLENPAGEPDLFIETYRVDSVEEFGEQERDRLTVPETLLRRRVASLAGSVTGPRVAADGAEVSRRARRRIPKNR